MLLPDFCHLRLSREYCPSPSSDQNRHCSLITILCWCAWVQPQNVPELDLGGEIHHSALLISSVGMWLRSPYFPQFYQRILSSHYGTLPFQNLILTLLKVTEVQFQCPVHLPTDREADNCQHLSVLVKRGVLGVSLDLVHCIFISLGINTDARCGFNHGTP